MTLLRRRVALDPLTSDSNEFVNLFSSAVEHAGFEPAALDWDKLGSRPLDLVVLHWPNEFFFRSSRRYTVPRLWRLWKTKLRYGTKIVWVAHNLRPHEGENGWPLIQSLFLRTLNGVIFLSNFSRGAINSLYKFRDAKELVTVHGLYEPRSEIKDRPAARSPNLLFFGQIRRYKNLEVLINAVHAAAELDFTVTIAGTCRDSGYRAELHELAGCDKRIKLDLRSAHLDPAELERTIDASDAIILPYKTVLNSGAVLHALSRARAVLAPEVGSLPELRDAVTDRWLHLYDGDLSAATLASFVEFVRQSPRDDRPDLSGFGWDRVADDLRWFINDVIES
jgi:beta-1,4-mannosyltransferase